MTYIPERTVLNAVKAAGWTQIHPRGLKKPPTFARSINGIGPVEAYGHFEKNGVLVAVACTDRRFMTQRICVRTIAHPADYTGGTNQFVEDLDELVETLDQVGREVQRV